jgi:hypothetical protein
MWRVGLGVVAVAVVLYFLGFISLDSFMSVWSTAFVAMVKGALFAVVPAGFLLGGYLFLREAFS